MNAIASPLRPAAADSTAPGAAAHGRGGPKPPAGFAALLAEAGGAAPQAQGRGAPGPSLRNARGGDRSGGAAADPQSVEGGDGRAPGGVGARRSRRGRDDRRDASAGTAVLPAALAPALLWTAEPARRADATAHPEAPAGEARRTGASASRGRPAPRHSASELDVAGRTAARARIDRTGDRVASERKLPGPEGAAPAHAPGAPPGAAPGAELRPAAEPRAPVSTAAPAPLPSLDPSAAEVSGAIGTHAAHLRVESPQLGELALHVRVRDGVAHLRVEGDAGPLISAQAPELSRALAAEGLTLGRVEATEPPRPAPAGPPDGQRGASADGGERREQPRERPDAEPPPPSHRRTAARAPARSPRSGHHVEA